MEQKYILALEIGSSKIKGAVGVLEDGVLTVNAIEEEKLVDSVSHGLIINVENVASRVLSIIRKLENRVSPRKVRSVYIGIGGRSFMSSMREVERQLPVEEQITDELVAQLRDEALATALADREVVTVADGEYLIDRHSHSNPVGIYGRNVKAVFNLITCRQQVTRNLRRAISERLGLKINDVFVRQLAEADLVLSSDERRQGCMLVDFGAETTTVSIYRNDALCYMATIPLGSRNITRDIKALSHLEERAESLKLAGGNAMPGPAKQVVDGIDFTEINNYVSARAAEIIYNVAEQLKYAKVRPEELPGGIIMVGGGAKLKGFKELMEKLTKIKKVHGGMPSPTIRIADMRIPAYDSIDVISILAAAARSPQPVDCMTAPAPKPQPVEEEKHETAVAHEPQETEAEDPFKKTSILDNEPDDDPYGEDTEYHKPRGNIFRKVTDFVNRIMQDGPSDYADDDR